ncbi:hypothetical protein HDU97_004126 [Phlyctochytrium planicorne]|nr:hypothetical protein HDU97_004126 [Phlyctochytrium planicorne]
MKLITAIALFASLASVATSTPVPTDLEKRQCDPVRGCPIRIPKNCDPVLGCRIRAFKRAVPDPTPTPTVKNLLPGVPGFPTGCHPIIGCVIPASGVDKTQKVEVEVEKREDVEVEKRAIFSIPSGETLIPFPPF